MEARVPLREANPRDLNRGEHARLQVLPSTEVTAEHIFELFHFGPALLV
jgi:hypothetical protein